MRLVVAVLMISLAGACASGSSTRPDEAPIAANRSAMWEDGAKAIETGEAMLTKGEKRLALGRQQIREGEAKIRTAGEQAKQARLDYEQAAAGGSEASGKRSQTDALREIGSRWEAAIQDIKDGRKLVATGNANIDRGESEVREGRLLMETGSVLVRNAHRSRLGLSPLPLPGS